MQAVPRWGFLASIAKEHIEVTPAAKKRKTMDASSTGGSFCDMMVAAASAKKK